MSASLVIVLGLLALTQVNCLEVTVFYESLCPDSIRFITRQLYPTYQKLGSEFVVDFVPYGKASHTLDPWSITCQHGQRECEGNAVQACMLSRLTNNTQQVEFVNCVMSASAPNTAGPQCAQKLNLTYSGVDECAEGKQGQTLLASLGDKTHNFKPTITFVPTVVIDDVYNSNNQNLALRNFQQLICDNLDEPKPSACSFRRYYRRH